jgi:hypothetical protein
MRSRIDFDLENVQRAAQLRRLGRDLHDQAAAISVDTVEATAAVVSRLPQPMRACGRLLGVPPSGRTPSYATMVLVV